MLGTKSNKMFSRLMLETLDLNLGSNLLERGQKSQSDICRMILDFATLLVCYVDEVVLLCRCCNFCFVDDAVLLYRYCKFCYVDDAVLLCR